MQRFENWMSYSFDNVEYGLKTEDTKSFTINFNKKFKPITSLSEALYQNARLMREMYSEPFDVLLSGGTDSEVVVRVFKDLKIKHNTFIFRFEDNLNYRDVNDALNLCKELNLDYNLIDFNTKKFYENDAFDIFKKNLTTSVVRLWMLKCFELLENIPVIAQGEPYFKRELNNDFSKKSKWLYPISESELTYSIASRRMNRIVIDQWYEYTPFPLIASMNHPIFKSLLNDEIKGRCSTWSSRHLLYKEIWPNFNKKQKLAGFEGEGPAGSYPSYLDEFANKAGKLIEDTEFFYTPEEISNNIIDYS